MFGLQFEYLMTISGILKLVEIVSVVVTFGILRGSGTLFDVDAVYVGAGVCFAAMLCTPLLLICYLMGKTEIQQTVMEFSLNFLFFFFFGVFGLVAIIDFSKYPDSSNRDEGIAMGVFALISAAAYLADTVFAIYNYNK